MDHIKSLGSQENIRFLWQRQGRSSKHKDGNILRKAENGRAIKRDENLKSSVIQQRKVETETRWEPGMLK